VDGRRAICGNRGRGRICVVLPVDGDVKGVAFHDSRAQFAARRVRERGEGLCERVRVADRTCSRAGAERGEERAGFGRCGSGPLAVRRHGVARNPWPEYCGNGKGDENLDIN
jgi:hypothetical protein